MKATFTLSQAIDGYMLDAQARRLSQDTIDGYTKCFNKLTSFLRDDLPITDITPDQARQFLAGLPTLSNTTLHHIHSAMSSLWKWAERNKVASENIMRMIQAPRPEEKEVQPFTREEISAMLATLEKSQPYRRQGKRECVHTNLHADRNRAIILILLDTGIRATEMCNLRICDIDLKARHISILMGKGKKGRQIPLSPQTAQSIWRYLASRKDDPVNLPLFVSHYGTPLNRISLNHLIRDIGNRAGVKNAHPHRFRHTFSINYLRNGGDIYTLQKCLGHATLDMVKRYLSISQADLETAHRQASPVANWRL